MTTYTGGCHCGNIRYEVTCELEPAMECNCSHCAKKGFLLTFVPKDFFKMTGAPEETMSEYRFNKKRIAHRFCPSCGVQTHGRGSSPDGSETVAVNIRTLDNLPEHIEIKKIDGKNF